MKPKLLALFTLLIFFNSLVFGDETAIPRWEYKVWVQPDGVHAVSRSAAIEEELNRLGALGWELVSVAWKKNHDRTSPTGRMLYYFKRPVRANAASLKPDQPQSNTSKISIEQALERSKADWYLKAKPKKRAEQGSARQPATAVDSKSEGRENTKPESGGAPSSG